MRYVPALLMMILASGAQAETLVYQGSNKWVAAADNAPLKALVAKAKTGHSTFVVTLPESGRELAVVRLEILTDILEKSSPKGSGVVFTEAASGHAAPNTIEINAQ